MQQLISHYLYHLNYCMLIWQPESFLLINQVCRFSTANQFTQSLPSECLLRNLSQEIDNYKPKILRIIDVALPIFTDGFFPLKRSDTLFWDIKNRVPTNSSKISLIFSSGFPGKFSSSSPRQYSDILRNFHVPLKLNRNSINTKMLNKYLFILCLNL